MAQLENDVTSTKLPDHVTKQIIQTRSRINGRLNYIFENRHVYCTRTGTFSAARCIKFN